MWQESSFFLAAIANPYLAIAAWRDVIINSLFLIAGFTNLFLAFYVYWKNPKERLNKNFSYFGYIIFLWCVSGFLSSLMRNIFWLRISLAAGTLVPIGGLFFGFAMAEIKISKLLKISIITLCGIIFYICLTPLNYKELLSYNITSIDANYGPLNPLWATYQIVASLAGLCIPLYYLRRVEGKREKQIFYFVFGATIFAFWALMVDEVLPFFGFSGLSNIDSPATIFMVGFTSYAIIKYNLMDIKSLLFHAFIYSSVIVLIIASLLLLVFVSSFLFNQLLIWPIYLIVIAASIALFFVGRLFFLEKRDLEKAKISLTESLKNSEENRIKAEVERDKTATIVSSFSDGLILLDEEDKIYSVNPKAEEMLGLEAGKLLRKPFQALSDFVKAKPVASALSSGLKSISQKEIELAKDFIIELSIIPLNLDKEDIGHLIVLHNISREKIVENMKTEFVSLAAHQLRTPLSIIKWSMSMLKAGDFGKLNKKQDAIVIRAFQNNERLISLVNDLLNVTRIEEGRYLYAVAMSDIKEIVNLVIDSYKDKIKKKKIEIEFRNTPPVPQTMVDSEKMRLAVQNLVDNAINYSPEGARVIIAVSSGKENIEFSIQDFGMGIPKKQQERIFSKFFRGDNAIKVNAVGTGLGLFLAQNIVEAHGGRIWFESEDGALNHGSTFHFSLPIKKN